MPKDGVSDMATQSAQFERVAWWWTRHEIGRDLRKRYEVSKELPPKLQTLVMKVDAIEGSQLLSYSGTPSDHERMVEARTIAGVKAFPDWFVLT
jgi:hypothetical protein